jgi:hypothetical protein
MFTNGGGLSRGAGGGGFPGSQFMGSMGGGGPQGGRMGSMMSLVGATAPFFANPGVWGGRGFI